MAQLMNKKSFIKNAEGLIASYDYTDVSSGTGYVIYNGFATQASGAVVSYALTSNPVEGDPISTTAVNTTASETRDFDVTFNTPKTIKGTAIINFTHGTYTASNNSNGNWVKITIYHGRGATYTSLGTAECDLFACDADGEQKYQRRSLKIPIAETHFKIGDVLRVTALWTATYAGSSGNTYSSFHFNPANATLTSTGGLTYNSSFKAHIPFRIDL